MMTALTRIGTRLWRDELGAIVSAEAVMVATLGVAGATVGIEAVSKSLNEELTDVALAIRSLDQSFSVRERRSAGAVVPASKYLQTDVNVSRAEILEHRKPAETL